jgi:hypothetical protein
MEGVYYELDTPAQFWGELDEIIAPVGTSPTHIAVDKAVRSFVRFAAAFRGTIHPPDSEHRGDTLTFGGGIEQYLAADEDIEHCCAALFRSQFFIQNADKVRYELISIAKVVTTFFSFSGHG